MSKIPKRRTPYLLTIIALLFPAFVYSESTEFQSVLDESAVWDNTTISVCWENPNDHMEATGWVKEAISNTWQKYSALKFTDWGKCKDASNGIRIRIAEEWPRVRGFEKYLNGVSGGVILNFTFKGEFKCYHSTILECIEIIAVHEFGHALGFHHEQNRSDTEEVDIECYEEEYQGSVPNELMIGDWDLNSVMNYCNPDWAGNGELSKGDISATQIIYGTNTIGTYTRYNIRADKADPGYPKAITQKIWPDVWIDGFDASINWGNGKAYFFKGAEYIRYDIRTDKTDPGYPKAITQKNWPGVWVDGLDASINWGNGKAYFFKGAEYIRYDIRADKADPGYPKAITHKIWPGVWTDGIDAATKWGDGKAYFFKGGEYIRYDLNADKTDAGYPKKISSKTWPDVFWSNGIDAATNWGNGKAYFFLR